MRRSETFLPMTVLFLVSTLVVFFAHQSTIRADDDHGDYRYTSTNLDIGSGPVAGVIDTSDIMFDVDYFSFQAQRGVKYTFVLDKITVDDADLSIINSIALENESPPDQELTVSGEQKTVSWIARSTDTYYVAVIGTLNNSDASFYLGNYTLSGFEDTTLLDRHADHTAGASPITPENIYQGAVSPWTNQPILADTLDKGDDSDFFSFQAQRGVKYSVDVELGTSDGVDIAIQSGFSTLEKTNDGIGNTLNWISPQSSTYYVVVSGTTRVRDSSGTYTIKLDADTSLLDQHSGTASEATLASFGNDHQGAISPADDADYFSFKAQRGIKYIFDVTLGSADGISLTVMETDGSVMTSNEGVGSTLEWISPSDGTFLAVLSASSQVPDVIGTYSLNLSLDNSFQDKHGDLPESATILNFDNAHPGAVSPKTDQDYFSFLAERGVRYSVELELLTTNGVVISINDSEGETISSTNGIGTGLGWTASTSGLFYVVISHSPQATYSIGSYSLVVSANNRLQDRHLDTPSAGTPLRSGNVYQGAISPKSDLDFFTLHTKRGVEYLFDLTYGSLSAVSLEVHPYGNSAETSARNFGESDLIRWTAPTSAPYIVKVSSSAKAIQPIGTYSLKVTQDTSLQDRHSDNTVDSTPIGFGNAISGAISPSNDYDYFRFMAEKGSTYTVNVEAVTVEGVQFSVENPSARFSTSNFGLEHALELKAPEAGWYTVSVSSSGQVASKVGTYMITIDRQNDVQPELPKSVVSTPAPAQNLAPRLINPTGTAMAVESRVAPVGSIVRVPINLINAENITSLGFTLNYDSDSLRVSKVAKGSRLTEDTFSFIADSPGKVRFGFANTKGSVPGGTAAIVEFRVIGSQGTLSAMTLSNALVNHNANGPLNIELVGATFKVKPRIKGDADGDGNITTLDAFQVLKMAASNQEADLSLDIDNDGKITVEDARAVLNMARPS